MQAILRHPHPRLRLPAQVSACCKLASLVCLLTARCLYNIACFIACLLLAACRLRTPSLPNGNIISMTPLPPPTFCNHQRALLCIVGADAAASHLPSSRLLAVASGILAARPPEVAAAAARACACSPHRFRSSRLPHRARQLQTCRLWYAAVQTGVLVRVTVVCGGVCICEEERVPSAGGGCCSSSRPAKAAVRQRALADGGGVKPPLPHRLTLARLCAVHGDTLLLQGVDLVHGTPILDV